MHARAVLRIQAFELTEDRLRLLGAVQHQLAVHQIDAGVIERVRGLVEVGLAH